jgi:hypothetical protein
LADGDFVVSWTSNSDPASTQRPGFSAQRYDAEGQRSGSRIVLSRADVAAGLADYAIQAASGGGFLLNKIVTDVLGGDGCFIRSRPTATSVVYYDQNLVPRQILAPTHCASVLPLKDGNYMVFQANDAGPYAQLIDSNGALIGPQKPIAARTAPIGAKYTSFAARQVLADGSYLLFWNSQYLTGDLKVQRYTSKGDPVGEVVSPGLIPRDILSLTDGDALLTGFVANPQDPATSLEIYTQRLTDPDEVNNGQKHWRRKHCHGHTQGMADQVRKSFMNKCFDNQHGR